jgi:hypothetical protein
MDLELRNNNSSNSNNNSSAEVVALVVADLEGPARQHPQEEWGWMQEVELALASEHRRRKPPEHDEKSGPNVLVVVHRDTPLSCLLQSKALCCY